MNAAEAVRGLAAKTAEMNAAFDAADDAGKRVIIAQDVIAALAEKRIVPTAGNYLSLPHDPENTRNLWGDIALESVAAKGLGAPSDSFRDLLAKLPPCQVCAKGAIFVCTVARRNQVTNAEAFRPLAGWGGAEMRGLLGDIFDAEQLSIIEREFEGGANDNGISDEPVMGLFEEGEDEDGYRDGSWKELYNDETRMTMIMQNIVRNGGTFVPEQGVPDEGVAVPVSR